MVFVWSKLPGPLLPFGCCWRGYVGVEGLKVLEVGVGYNAGDGSTNGLENRVMR